VVRCLALALLLVGLCAGCRVGSEVSSLGVGPPESLVAGASPTGSPVPTLRARLPLGRGNQAIVVEALTGDGSNGERIEVSLMAFDGDAFAGQPVAEVIANVPLTLPAGSWLDWPRVRVSRTGWLAMSFWTGPNEDERVAATMILDLREPDRAPWIVDADTWRAFWGPDDQLLIVEPTTLTRGEARVRVFKPADRTAVILPADPSVWPLNAWLADGSGIMAARSGERTEIGILSLDGAFQSLGDAGEIPGLFASTGLERPAGRSLRTGGVGCDGSGSEATGRCVLYVQDRDGSLLAVWGREGEGRGVPSDHAWDSQGQGLWTVTTTELGADSSMVFLAHVTGSEATQEVGTAIVERPPYWSAQFLGISGEASGQSVFLIGDDDRLVAAISSDGSSLSFGGTALFAGWANDPGGYNPASQ
jgi:hypothetical protein